MKKNKSILVLYLILYTSMIFSQLDVKYGYIGYFHADINWILSEEGENDLVFKYNDPENKLGLVKIFVGDTVIYHFENDKDFNRKLIYNYAKSCSFDKLVFKDETSALDYFNKILKSNIHGWKKISEHIYHSKKKYKTEMTILDNTVTYRLIIKNIRSSKK